MTERNLDTNPYSEGEARVAKFLYDRGVGGGDDPIGFLMVSYAWVMAERKAENRAKLELTHVWAMSLSTLESEINKSVEHGWELHGGIIIHQPVTAGYPAYYQFLKKKISE